jgi:hypothetical protein
MWSRFIAQGVDVPKHYNNIVRQAIEARNLITHGRAPSLTDEELSTLAKNLRQISKFVSSYSFSGDMLPELINRYTNWLRPEIRAVRIVQKGGNVFLEITTTKSAAPLVDEQLNRTDLSFIGSPSEEVFFPPSHTAQDNARRFIEEFDPYSIINCTDLFTEEACHEVDRLFNPLYNRRGEL